MLGILGLLCDSIVAAAVDVKARFKDRARGAQANLWKNIDWKELVFGKWYRWVAKLGKMEPFDVVE